MSTPRVPKIAYIMTPITFGGSEKVNLNFLINADRQRLYIDPILFLRPWEDKTVFETELQRFGIEYLTVPVAKTNGLDIFRIFRSYHLLKKLIKGNSYDLLHTHGYLADFFGFLVSKSTNIPIISTCHGFIDEDVKLSLYYKLDRIILKRFDKIIAVSDQIKGDLVKHGIISDNVSTIINAAQVKVDKKDLQKTRANVRSDLNIMQNEIVIGYVGRLSKEKGLLFLLEAVAMLMKDSLAVKLLIVGEGAQRNELDSMAKSLDIATNVIFAGFQNNVEKWVTAMDFFVLPSLSEGTPMALLEVMSQGVPCIASAVGGIPQVIESGIDGILVAPGRPDEIRDAILMLSKDCAKKNTISSNANAKISSKYDIRNWTRKIEHEYTCVVANRKL